MAGEIENEDDDVLELGETPDDTQGAAGGEDTQPSGEGDDDIEIPTFGDLGDEEDGDTDLIKHLRAELRKAQAKAKENDQGRQAEPEIVVGDKPTLESCEWDEDKFEEALTSYHERKRQADAKANAGRESLQRAQQELAQVVTAYNEKKAALPYPDKDDMEATVLAALAPAQQEIAIRVAGDGAKLFYALGRNPTKLAALAGMAVTDIASVAKFGAAIAKLDGELKMAKRRPTAEPDRPVRGSGSMSGGGDLEKQIDKAVAKGDFATFRRLQKQMKDKAA